MLVAEGPPIPFFYYSTALPAPLFYCSIFRFAKNGEGNPDSNRRLPAPKAGALAKLSYTPSCDVQSYRVWMSWESGRGDLRVTFAAHEGDARAANLLAGAWGAMRIWRFSPEPIRVGRRHDQGCAGELYAYARCLPFAGEAGMVGVATFRAPFRSPALGSHSCYRDLGVHALRGHGLLRGRRTAHRAR